MAGRSIRVNIIGDADSLKKAFGQSATAAETFGSRLQTVGRTMQTVGKSMSLFVTAPMVAFGALSVKAAMDAEQSMAMVDQAFRSAGIGANEYAKQLEVAQKAAVQLGFDDEDAAQSLARFSVATGNVAKSMKLLTVAEDLARFKGVDLATATQILTSAAGGNTRAIKAMGIAYIPTTTNVDKLRAAHKASKTEITAAELATAKLADKQANFGNIVDIVGRKVRGQAGAFSETAAGGMARFREQMENLQESIGQVLLPVLNTLVGYLSSLVQWFQSLDPSTKKWIAIMAGVAVAIGPVVGIIGTLITAIEGLSAAFLFLAANPVVLVIGAFAALTGAMLAATYAPKQFQAILEKLGVSAGTAAGIVKGLGTAFQVFKGVVLAAISPITLPLETLFRTIQAGVRLVAALFRGDWSAAWQAFKTLALAPITALVNTVKRIAPDIGSALSQVGSAVTRAFSALWKAVSGAATTALSKAKEIGSNIVDGIVNGLATLYREVKGALDALWRVITNVAGSALNAATAIGSGIIEGIISGLGSVASRVAGYLRDKISSAINSVKSFFGIGSPSKVTAEQIGKPLMEGIAQGIIDGQPQVEGAAKKAAQRAVAVAKASEIIAMAREAGRLLGDSTVVGIINGVIGKTPSLKQQIRIAIIDKFNEVIAEARTKYSDAFGSLADAATNAFNAKIAAWKSPSQMILDKLALAKTLSDIGDTLGPAAETLMEKIGAALAKGNVKLATRLEAELNGIIATALAGAQTDLAAAKAGLAAAEATGDPEAIAKAQEAVTAAQKNFDDITQAQQTALTLLAAQETAAHDKKVAADQARFAKDLAALNAALQNQNLSVQEKHRKILKFLEDEGLGKKVAAELRGKIKAVEEAADALAQAIKDRLSFTTTVTVNVVTQNVPPGGIPGKAAGGPVFAGMPYIVGERGPELFVPSRGGTIVPNGATAVASAGGYGAIHVHVGTVIGNDLEGAARELAGPLRRELTRHAQRNR